MFKEFKMREGLEIFNRSHGGGGSSWSMKGFNDLTEAEAYAKYIQESLWGYGSTANVHTKPELYVSCHCYNSCD